MARSAIFNKDAGFVAGVGHRGEVYSVDFSWQYDLPQGENTGASNILDGEYNSTTTQLWLGLSVTRKF